jgi:hypothetical protein
MLRHSNLTIIFLSASLRIISVIPLILIISFSEIKEKMYELLIIGTDNLYDYPKLIHNDL